MEYSNKLSVQKSFLLDYNISGFSPYLRHSLTPSLYIVKKSKSNSKKILFIVGTL